MKFSLLCGLFLLLTGSAGEALPLDDCTEKPGSRAAAKLQAVIKVMNSGNIDETRKFIAENHSKDSLDWYGEGRLFDLYYGMFERYGGLEFHCTEVSSENKEVAVFRCPATGTGYLLGVTLETSPPHQIRGMTIRPLADVAQAEEPPAYSVEQAARHLACMLDHIAKRNAFCGVVLAAKDGKIIFNAAYGLAIREKDIPFEIDTRLNLASITKMFTAVAIGQLFEQGKLSFEDPVGKYLGADWIDPEIGAKVRIKHLLSHSSGLGGGDFAVTFVEAALAGGYEQVDEYKPLSVNRELDFEPGAGHDYSNLGFQLLGAVIEKTTGERYSEYIKEHIFDPARMADADLGDFGELQEDTAIGYVMEKKNGAFTFKNNRSRLTRTGQPFGGGYATAEDLYRFAQALRNHTLVSAETREILFTARADLNSPRYGFGFQVASDDGRKVVSHTGGWTGINNSFSMGVDDDWTVIVLTNIDILSTTACQDIDIIARQILNRICDRTESSPAEK